MLHSVGERGIRSVLLQKNQTPLNTPSPPSKRRLMTRGLFLESPETFRAHFG